MKWNTLENDAITLFEKVCNNYLIEKKVRCMHVILSPSSLVHRREKIVNLHGGVAHTGLPLSVFRFFRYESLITFLSNETVWLNGHAHISVSAPFVNRTRSVWLCFSYVCTEFHLQSKQMIIDSE